MRQLTSKNYLGLLSVIFFPLALWAGVNEFQEIKTGRINVDNVRIDGNTVSSTDTNGDLTVTPNGTGKLIYTPGTATTVPYLDASKKLVSSSVTPTELGYLSGVTSAVQTQLGLKAPLASPTFTGTVTLPVTASRVLVTDGSSGLTVSSVTSTTLAFLDIGSSLTTLLAAKAPLASPTFTGTVTTPALNMSGLTATTVPYLDGSKNLTSSAVTPTELGYLSGVTSAIQTQLGTQTTNIALKANIASPTFTGTVTTPALNMSGLTATTVPYLDASKNLTSSAATPTQLGYLANATSNLCGISQACVETSKTFTTPAINGANFNFGTASNTNRLLLPSDTSTNLSGYTNTAGLLAYDTTLSKPVYNNGTLWTAVGSGGGGGSKNYLGTINGTDNGGDFEGNTVGSWVIGNVSLTSAFPSGTPTFGSGASANLSGSIATGGTQLSGTYSYLYRQLSGVTVAGNFMASPAVTVDISDQAKVLTFKFNYKATVNPTNANWSGTSSNSFGIAIWDVTANSFIMPAGVWGMTQSTGVGTATGTFQTTSSSTQYRLVVFNANASAGAISVEFDDFFLGPQTAPIGPVVTDWQSYTPTGSWSTNTTYTGIWRRVGADMEVVVNLALAGAPTNAALTVNLPTGYTIDSTRLLGTPVAASNPILGEAILADAGVQAYPGPVVYNSTTSVYIYAAGAASSQVNVAALSTILPFTWGAGDSVYAKFKVPISGWSSNVQMSNDTDTRVISARVYKSGTQAFSVLTKVTSWTVDNDRAGMWDATNNRFNIPVSGDYVLTLNTNGAPTTTAQQIPVYRVNGVATDYYVGTVNAVSTSDRFNGSALIPNLKAGDYIEIYHFTSAATTIGAGLANTSASIFRISGPAVVAATESVNAKRTGSTTTVNNTTPTLSFPTSSIDSHTATTSAGFTAPVSGKYYVSLRVRSASVAWAVTNIMEVYYSLNGGGNTVMGRSVGPAGTYVQEAQGTTVLALNAGDALTFKTYSDVSNALQDGQFLIYRVGN